MTAHQKHRQRLLWAIHRWLRRYGVWYVFFLSFLVAAPEMVFAAPKTTEPANLSTLLVSKETAPGKKAVQAVSKVAKTPLKSKLSAKEREARNKKGFPLPDPDPMFDKEDVVTQQTKGTVTGAAKYGLAVETVDPKKGGMEYWFNYTKGIHLTGLRALSDIQEGDTVSATFKETKDNHRLIKELALVQKKPKETAQSEKDG